MSQIDAIGVLVPAHRDGPAAKRLIIDLLAAANSCRLPVSIVLADNGDNEGFDGGIPNPLVSVIEVAQRGPGYARTAAAQRLIAAWRQANVQLDNAWIVSLDADSAIEPSYLADWLATISNSGADILTAPSFFAPLNREPGLPPGVDAASAWLWSFTSLLETFAGVVNTGGCNHAVRASVCEANDFYIQPVEQHEGHVAIVPGDDWDFGLRARLRGFKVERVGQPAVLTSVRRLVSDPAGFLSGQIYEGAFEPVAAGAEPTAWPPREDWSAIADRGRARIVAHFLFKPSICGLPIDSSLRWFLGEDLWTGLGNIRFMPPPKAGQWQEFRSQVIAELFEPETFDLARRIGRRLSGI